MPGCSTLADRLAARLARDGESEPAIHIEETDTTFDIGWKGRYTGLDVTGPFVREGSRTSDQDTAGVATILGYPTDKLSQIG